MPAPGVAKIAKDKHVKRAPRDAQSAQALQDAAKKGLLGPELQAVVMRDESRWRIRHAKKLARKRSGACARPWAAKGSSYTVGLWKTPHPRWFENTHRMAKAHRTSAPWRDITDTYKAHLAHLVLSLGGEFRAFTLNLGSDVEAQALARGAEARNWISDRLVRRLKQTLERPALFWFRLEISTGKRPYLHLHGELACAPSEVNAIRDALRDAGGAWAGRKQDQVHTHVEYPDLGWVSYVMKSDYKHMSAAMARLRGAAQVPSWRDDRFFVSEELNRRTKALYEGVRPLLKLSPAASIAPRPTIANAPIGLRPAALVAPSAGKGARVCSPEGAPLTGTVAISGKRVGRHSLLSSRGVASGSKIRLSASPTRAKSVFGIERLNLVVSPASCSRLPASAVTFQGLPGQRERVNIPPDRDRERDLQARCAYDRSAIAGALPGHAEGGSAGKTSAGCADDYGRDHGSGARRRETSEPARGHCASPVRLHPTTAHHRDRLPYGRPQCL